MMACMEHHCLGCDRTWFDNKVWQQCPTCSSPWVSNWFDEEPDYDEPEYDDEYEPTRDDDDE